MAITVLDAGMGSEVSVRIEAAGHGLWSAKALNDAPHVVQDIHREYIDAGARIIGSCCGIGPVHIKALPDKLAST